MRLWSKLLTVAKLHVCPRHQGAGLYLKTWVQKQKWPNSLVSGSPLQAGHVSLPSGTSSGLCDPTLLSFIESPRLRCLQLAILPLRRTEAILRRRGGSKTLFQSILSQRFWRSQMWNIKEVWVKMQKWQTTGGGAEGHEQLQVLNILRATLIFIKEDFSRVWWIFSGLGKSPLHAKIMNNTEGQEPQIYWLVTEMGST